MKDYLDRAQRRFYLSLGHREFSPVMQVSAAIALDFSREIENTGVSKPMLITFPNKGSAALWLSVQYLVNALFNDSIYQSENRIKELGLKSGDVIDVFSATCIYKGIDPIQNKLVLGFSDGIREYSRMQNAQFINSTKKKRVNKYTDYRNRKNNFLNKKKALTQILNLDANPNFGAFTSKVVLVSGRGNAGLFRKQLFDAEVYDESLAEAILLDRNLLISPDFQCFDGSVDSNSAENTDFFCKAVRRVLGSVIADEHEVKFAMNSCLELLESDLKTKLFIESYESLYNCLSKHSKYLPFSIRLQNLLRYHPGIEDDLINKVAAVIINDLQLFIENPKTIDYLLNHKIPVYVISDRIITDYKDLDIYSRIFNSDLHSGMFRFNWDKNKINDLKLSKDNGIKYIDFEINNSCYKFLKQKIVIHKLALNNFDNIFNSIESKRFLASIEGIELLQTSYYTTLRPLLYLIKNSINISDNRRLLNALEDFNLKFNSCKVDINKDAREYINESLSKLEDYILTEDLPKGNLVNPEYVLFQNLVINESNYKIPTESINSTFKHLNHINSESENIIFFGYPYREFSFKLIDESIFSKLIPNVDFILNQCEADITFNFILRKISTGYFEEHYPDSLNALDEFKVSNEDELRALITDAITVKNHLVENYVSENVNVGEFEEFEQMLSELRYSGHKGAKGVEESASQYLLNSDVVHFANGSYVFFPHRWRILTIRESITGKVESRMCKISDVAVGDVAVIVNVSRKSISKYLEGSNKMLSHLRTLESWRDVLKEYHEKCKDVSKTVSQLDEINREMELGGSAENYNVLRWLHDEEMLSPAIENLKMILGLKYPKGELSSRAELILSAKAIVLKAKNRLDRAVKDKIVEIMSNSYSSLSDTFTVEVSGIEVNGEKNKIVGIEKRQDLNIEYHSVMKFLK